MSKGTSALNNQLGEYHRRIQRHNELVKLAYRDDEGYDDYFKNKVCPYTPMNNRGPWEWEDGQNYYIEYMTWWRGYNQAKIEAGVLLPPVKYKIQNSLKDDK